MTDLIKSDKPHSPKQHLISWLNDQVALMKENEKRTYELEDKEESDTAWHYVFGKMCAYREVLDYITKRW